MTVIAFYCKKREPWFFPLRFEGIALKQSTLLIDEWLPFLKSRRLNHNHINTLIALSEIYARKDDLVTSVEMKRRLELVKNDGKNASPYFKWLIHFTAMAPRRRDTLGLSQRTHRRYSPIPKLLEKSPRICITEEYHDRRFVPCFFRSVRFCREQP